jgi:hypothetical protein
VHRTTTKRLRFSALVGLVGQTGAGIVLCYAKPSRNEKYFIQAGRQCERVLVYGFPSPYVASSYRRRTILCFPALSKRMKWRLSQKQTGLVNSRRHLLTGHREYQSSFPDLSFLPNNSMLHFFFGGTSDKLATRCFEKQSKHGSI